MISSVWGDSMTTGDLIKEARKKAGLTQKQLGERLGLSFQAVAQWENNLRNPKQETINKIADALGIDPIFLLPESEREKALQVRSAFERKDLREIEKLLGLEPNSVYPLSQEEADNFKADYYEDRLVRAFNRLNLRGKVVAVERIEELLQINKYNIESDKTPTKSSSPDED